MPRIFDGARPAPVAYTPTPVRTPVVLPGIARSDVKPGDVFRVYTNTSGAGSLGSALYGAVGKNGKLYSMNMSSGEVASTANPETRVKVVGSYKLIQTLDAVRNHRNTVRAGMTTDDLFKVKGGKKLYANLGRLNDGRFIAINVQSRDHAVTKLNDWRAGNKNVTKVGTYHVEMKLA